jgi:hypothetical protein
MKAYAALVVVALAGWGLFFYQRNQVPAVQTITVDKIVEKQVFVDRIVNKDMVRTETRPDGTKIVTESHSQDKSVTKEEVKAQTHSETVAVNSPLTKYSLGLGVRLDPFNPLKRQYEIDLGRRLWTTPIWGKLSVSTDKTVTLGLSVEF